MIFGVNMREYKLKAEFYDVDFMGVVWHGNYVKYLEVARCLFLDEIGFGYDKMRELGFAYPVAKMEFKYIAPIRFNDEFWVRVKLISIDGFLKFRYELLSEDKKTRLAKAMSSQICVDMRANISLYEAPKELKIAAKGRICQG